MYWDKTCVCLSASCGECWWWGLGWCRCGGGDQSSSAVTAEEAATSHISSRGILCVTVFTSWQWSTALWRFIWKQWATPRHTEYRRGHNSNATDTQHINIFQSIKIFFTSRILSYLEAWWPGSPARPGRRCRARGQPGSWRPSQSKHDCFMTRDTWQLGTRGPLSTSGYQNEVLKYLLDTTYLRPPRFQENGHSL